MEKNVNVKWLIPIAFLFIFLTGNAYATPFLEEEAGISAYVNVGSAIDINQTKGAYRTIEYSTDEYIVGSVELAGWPEYEDPHVYVSSDGWIVAYYLKEEPTSKIMQWLGYTGDQINTTKLEDAIDKMCTEIGIDYSTIKDNTKYYDFRYPDANRLMLIVDIMGSDGTDTFDFMIPSEDVLYNGSWSHYTFDSYGSNTKIDGVTINTLGECSEYYLWAHGYYENSQLVPNISHTVSIWHDEYSFGGYTGYSTIAVALVYQE